MGGPCSRAWRQRDGWLCLLLLGSAASNGSGCGTCFINGKDLLESCTLAEKPERRRGSAGSGKLTNAATMMFEHQLGTPLGLHRKPSRVETARRFWRVS